MSKPRWIITRQITEQNCIKLTDEDFFSQIEKKSLTPKGMEAEDWVNQIGQYSCSFWKTKEPLINAFKLPKRTKILIKGVVKPEHGVIKEDPPLHIHCWRYEGVSFINDFQLETENE